MLHEDEAPPEGGCNHGVLQVSRHLGRVVVGIDLDHRCGERHRHCGRLTLLLACEDNGVCECSRGGGPHPAPGLLARKQLRQPYYLELSPAQLSVQNKSSNANAHHLVSEAFEDVQNCGHRNLAEYMQLAKT